jgi:SIR2-like domain/TIR domain
MADMEGNARPAGAVEDGGPASGEEPTRNIKVFINYRRGDAGGWARALYMLLEGHFGADNVFFDRVTLQPGTKWLREIQSHGARSTVFLALIGEQWVDAMKTRSRAGDEDPVRDEIRLAVSLGATIIPTLVGDAAMPDPSVFPPDLEPLFAQQGFELHPDSFDEEVERLVAKLERGEPEPEPSPGAGAPAPAVPKSSNGAGNGSAPHSDFDDEDPALTDHFDFVAERILDGEVVPVIGPGANSSARNQAWEDPTTGCLPDSDELAKYLARTYRISAASAHLAEVAQYVSLRRAANLYETLTDSLTVQPPIEPTPVHRFLAGLPGQFTQLGAPVRPQLIVTTNWDDALEQAFTDAEPPPRYDLAVYMASGDDRRHFVHLPYAADPEVVLDGTSYKAFPIDNKSGRLEHTVIVKLHGAVDRSDGPYTWGNNYVLTEDDYIGYLSGSVSKVVPQQILAKLRRSHLLFLGYTMRDWNLRVFLQRVFGNQPIQNESWAIQSRPDGLDRGFWNRMPNMELFAMELSEYVSRLGAHLAQAARATVG